MSETKKLDLDAELVSALHNEPEAAQATPKGKVEAGEPGAQANEPKTEDADPALEGQPASEGDADGATEDDVEVADLLDDKGKFDIGKVKNLKKSHAHAQKLVGQTAKDREQLKKLPEVEKKAALLDTFETLTRLNPNILAEVARAQALQRGQPVHVQQPAAQPEDVEKKVTENMAKGKYREAVRALLDADPDIQEFRQTKAEFNEWRRQQQEEAQKAAWRSEREAWQKEYQGVIFDEKGAVKDTELHEYIQSNTLGRTATYKDATLLAMAELGRFSAPKPKNDPAKKQAGTMPQGRTQAPRKPVEGDDDEIMPGLTNAGFLQELKRLS